MPGVGWWEPAVKLDCWLPALKHLCIQQIEILLYGVLELEFVRKMVMAYVYYMLMIHGSTLDTLGITMEEMVTIYLVE